MSKHSNRLIVVRSSSWDSRKFVPYSADYGKFGAEWVTEFTNMKDARAVQEKMAAQEKQGRKWFVMRIEAEIAPAPAIIAAHDETDIG